MRLPATWHVMYQQESQSKYFEGVLVPRLGEIDSIEERQIPGQELGLPGRNILYPEYAIHNAAGYTVESNTAGGGISNHTVNTDIIHLNGLAMYDTHNLYGTSKFPKLV